jgi:hypothetical protein
VNLTGSLRNSLAYCYFISTISELLNVPHHVTTYRDRMANYVLLIRAKASQSGPQEQGSSEGADTPQQMDRSTAGEICVAQFIEPTSLSPCPVCDGGVHEPCVGNRTALH